MKRIAISVEGKTEVLFVKHVLAPYFPAKEIVPVNLDGHKTYNRIQKRIKTLLASFDFVTTFYDYYGINRITDFPGNNSDSVELREDVFRKDIDSHLFLPYLQLHEFEAFVFIDENITADSLLECDKDRVKKYIRNTREKFGNNPELINDSIHTAPSKRIKDIYQFYQKSTQGLTITSKLGIGRIMESCPKFRLWIELLESI